MVLKEPAQPRRKLTHVTPLRYPGGKGKLTPFVKRIMEVNDLLDGQYVEPYAGGAAIGLELLLDGFVSKIHVNDISRPIYSFWKAVLEHTEGLVRLVRNTRLTVRSWDRQKKVLAHADDHDDLALGFATFFLNRTNRSGILNGGIIGGRDQTGPWRIDARYNPVDLSARIEAIARVGRRILLSRKDAAEFLRDLLPKLPKKSLVYLDPPYYVKGKDLYYAFYQPQDHATIASLVRSIHEKMWIVSYDNVVAVRDLYRGYRSVTYKLAYSAREHGTGSEVMFFSPGMKVPEAASAMHSMRNNAARLV
jgi:DNA adenine methylase